MPAELPNTPKLAVAIVAPSLAILGGQAVQARQLLDGWKGDPDVEAWLVPINPSPRGWFAGLARIKYVRTIVTQLIYLPLLVRELRRADVVHVFSASYFSFLLAPLPAVLVARLFGRRVLVNYHSGEAPDHLRRSYLARRVLQSVEQNVVPSRFLQEVFAAHDVEARVIPNTIDRDRFRFRLREPLRPRLLSTRTLEPLYNVACTIRAFAAVQRRYPDATLTIVGGGSQEKALQQLAADLQLRGVSFAGRVPPDEIGRFYTEADIYVQTPDIDNMPLSILEAYASGLPVVSTNPGGVPSMLTDGVHGLLASVDDEKQVAENVIRLLEDPPFARRVALAAYDLTEALVWDRVRDQWLDVYRGLLDDPAAEPGTVTPI
jgi:glycosyltransferase involved in cell wall biosynthesis